MNHYHESIEKILDAGHTVTFDLVSKRMSIVDGGSRGFHWRYVWKTDSKECKWEGFASAKEMLDDFMKSHGVS